MSVQGEITRIETAKAAIAEAITAKGVDVPAGARLDDMAQLVAEIPEPDISGKADKAVPSAANNVALLNADGNLADSGKSIDSLCNVIVVPDASVSVDLDYSGIALAMDAPPDGTVVVFRAPASYSNDCFELIFDDCECLIYLPCAPMLEPASLFQQGAYVCGVVDVSEINTDIYGKFWIINSFLPTPENIGAALSSHNHSAGEITSGTLPASRGGTGYTSLSSLMSAINNRTTKVNSADTSYTTYMARGEALFATDTAPTTNGTIAWTYS